MGMIEDFPADKGEFQTLLLEWYGKNRRILPWREEPSPYRTWISEIMLQQTRVEAVRTYYLRFIERFPDIASLAEAGEEELNKLWEGLGYYSRARNLKKAAEILVRDYGATLPSSYEELLKLPGIGAYTAGAIASIAFGQSVPAVDGNVLRVMSRITGSGADIAEQRTRREMEQLVSSLIPDGKAGSFNQALMELGATVCVPNGMPKCAQCPVGTLCRANKANTQLALPIKKKKKDRRRERRTVLIFVDSRGRYLIRKRADRGLLAGMWEFPMLDGHYTAEELMCLFTEKHIPFLRIEPIGAAKHMFTHIEWEMEGYLVYQDAVCGDFPNIFADASTAVASRADASTAVAADPCADASGYDASKAGTPRADASEDAAPRTEASKADAVGDDASRAGAAGRDVFRRCDFETICRDYTFPSAFRAYLKVISEK